MGNQISRNVISIVYFLFYVGSAPNLLARNAIVLLFFFFSLIPQHFDLN